MKTRPITLITSTLPAGRLVEVGAAPRRALGIIERAEDAVFVLDIGEDFLLVGPVIAGGDHIDADAEEFLGDGAGEAEAAGGVLAIGDDEIQLQLVAQARQFAPPPRRGPACR